MDSLSVLPRVCPESGVSQALRPWLGKGLEGVLVGFALDSLAAWLGVDKLKGGKDKPESQEVRLPRAGT